MVTSIRPLKIAELREALATQYQLEGHTLLVEDECFPYSQRDLELLCGSLVSIRDETIQLIHLSIKEFLQQSLGTPSEESGSNRDLLVNPQKASLKLTQVCLAYLSVHCVEPLIDFNEKCTWVDYRIDEKKVEDHLQANALLEYACFGWLIHLLDCEVTDSAEAANYVLTTFDSPSTFCWIETCLALDRNSIWSLLIGLEEMGEWIPTSGIELSSVEFSTFDFVRRWATAIAEFLDQYKQTCVHRPWEVYFLDLEPLFRQFGLEGFYQRQGGKFAQRELVSVLSTNDEYQGFHDNVPKHLRLNIPWTTFIYDDARHVFFAIHLKNIYLTIHVQQASTGLCLPPIFDVSEQPFHYLHAVLNNDGKYLGVTCYNEQKILHICLENQ